MCTYVYMIICIYVHMYINNNNYYHYYHHYYYHLDYYRLLRAATAPLARRGGHKVFCDDSTHASLLK